MLWISTKLSINKAPSWTLLIHHSLTLSISTVVKGPDRLSRLLWLFIKRNIHAPTRKVRCKSCFSKIWSKSSCKSFVCATVNTFRMTLASTSEVSEDEVVGFGGHLSSFANYEGPFHQRVDPPTVPPRLAKSAGLSEVLTCRHEISGCARILFTRFWTNCLYSPSPRIQWRTTALSIHPHILEIGKPSRALFVFITRLVTMFETRYWQTLFS